MTYTALSSHVLTTPQAAMALQSSLGSSTAVFRSARAIARRTQVHTQTRTFRFGLWYSYLDPNFPRDVQRRHRIIKNKYIEAMNRKLAWDRQLPVHARQIGLKGFMCSAWQGRGLSSGSRWIDLDPFQNIQKNKDGGIEDVEQSPVDRLLKYQQKHRKLYQDWMNDFVKLTKPKSPESPWAKSDAPAKIENASVTPNSSPQNDDARNRIQEQSDNSVSSSDLEYEIDPITNRKVFKNPTTESKDIPVKTFKGYRSQFQTFSPPQDPDPVRESLKEYEKKEEYKPVYYNEPDGKEPETPCPVQEGLKDYDSKVTYGPVYGYEPDGQKPVKPCSVQNGLRDYDSRNPYGPVYYKEPDGKDPEKPCPVQEGLKDYDSRVNYGPVYYKEPDGKDPEKPCTVQEGLRDYDDQVTYEPVYFNEPDGKHPEKSCSVQQGLKDFDSQNPYGPVYYKEPDGKDVEKPCPVEEGLKEYDSKVNYGPSGPSNAKKVYPQKFDTPGAERILRYLGADRSNDLDLLRASDVRAASGKVREPRKETAEEKSVKRRQLDKDFAQSRTLNTSSQREGRAEMNTNQRLAEELRIEHSELLNHAAHAKGRINAKIAEVEAGWPESRSSKLTGNFVRDFPEEFETKWTSETGTLTPNIVNEYDRAIERKVQSAEKAFVDVTEPSTSFSQPPKIQTSLDRTTAAENVESSTQSPRLSEKEDALPTESEIPTVYKILAYDPTMQSINEAETTSIVSDSASPLTPAEVLLRLSNPSKFFPHFAPLQSQGYEIVSGSGDVLVFRKVRTGAPPKPANETSFASRDYKRRAMNPIDGMQPIAATGNFASPTGFVNHDLPEDPEPRFKSNIDVRREEPVFSGKSNWQDGEDSSSPKKKGRGKRLLIGAVWVGACSYAVGVVAEFFKTGGVDGVGPKGF